MSILAAVDPAISTYGLLVGLFAAASAVAVAWLFGILRNAKLKLEPRIPPDRPMAPLVGATFAALVVWLVLGPWLLGTRAVSETGSTPTTVPVSLFGSDRQLILVSAIVPTAAFIVLLVGDALVRPRVRQRLGFNAERLPKGFGIGITGMLIAMPLIYGSMIAAEWVYQQVGYYHPPAHDLLRTMDQTPDRLVRNLAIVVAVVVAPLWEELLFRGHIQTLLREGFARIRETASDGDAGIAPARSGTTLEYFANAPALVPGVKPRAADSWLAILLTSAIFASIHQPWTAPPIFVLSLCFGFAYERTGNLWVPVAMHASFNGLMTAYFLVSASQL